MHAAARAGGHALPLLRYAGGDEVFFLEASQTATERDRWTHGQAGEVTGASEAEGMVGGVAGPNAAMMYGGFPAAGQMPPYPAPNAGNPHMDK